jgi:hypothetical protein
MPRSLLRRKPKRRRTEPVSLCAKLSWPRPPRRLCWAASLEHQGDQYQVANPYGEDSEQDIESLPSGSLRRVEGFLLSCRFRPWHRQLAQLALRGRVPLERVSFGRRDLKLLLKGFIEVKTVVKILPPI